MKSMLKTTQKKLASPSLSIFIGFSVGTIIYLFKILSKFSLKANILIYQFIRENIILIPLSLGIFFLISILIDKLVWYEPNAGGSSISRTSYITKQYTNSRWYSIVFFTIITTLIVFVIGVPLGIEGPSIMIGAGLSLAFMKHKQNKFCEDDNAMVLSGIGSGFTAATGTIFASVIFVFEEIYKKKSSSRIISTLIASISAFITIVFFDKIFNFDTIGFFNLPSITNLTLNYVFIIPIIGIFAGLSGAFFNFNVKITNHFFAKYILHMPRYLRYFIILILIFIIGLLYNDTLGSGQYTILTPLFNNQFSFQSLIIVLVVKTVLISLANAADIPGGMFVPVLVIGGLYAALTNNILIYYNFPPTYTLFLTLLFMASFFASSTKAPLTSFVFFSEISLSIPFTLFLAPTLLISHFVSYILNTQSINDIVIEENEKIKLEDNIQYGIPVRVKGSSCAIGRNIDSIFHDDIKVHGYAKSETPHLSFLCDSESVINKNDIIIISFNGEKESLKKLLDYNLKDYELVYD